jgi:hypothetical protein
VHIGASLRILRAGGAPLECGAMSTEPALDPEKAERLELARAFAFNLVKGIKQIGMYRHNENRFPEFLGKAHEAVAAYTSKHGALTMKVDAQNLVLYGQPLFDEASPLAYRFFRDGIRQLIFRQEIGVEELVTLTLIALSDPERGDEDVLAQLWRSSLPHVEYVVVEGFKMEEVSDEEVEVEVDKVVSFLYGRLKTDSDDYLRFARVSTEDLDSRHEEVDQIRGAVVTGTTASDQLKARVQKELEEEEQRQLFPKLVGTMFQVIEGGIDDARFLEDVFVQLLDAMLMQEDFATINNIVVRLRALEQTDKTGVVASLTRTLTAKMGEEQRLGRVGEVLRSSKLRSSPEVLRYLEAVGTNGTIALLDVLGAVEIAENRALLCEALSPHARHNPEPFVNRLESERSQTVRDMVHILESSGHPDRVRLFSGVMHHPNVAVKLDVLGIIAKGQSSDARKLVVEALNDANAQVRILAARLLPEFDRDKALADLTRLVKDPGFDRKSAEEKTALYAALGATGLPGALALLSQVLATKGTLLNKKKVTEDKLLAVGALAAASSIQALKLLQAVLEDKSQAPEVLAAARKAATQTRKTLFGETAEAP